MVGAYTLSQFGSILLPQFAATQDIGTPDSVVDTIPLPDGTRYPTHGSGTARPALGRMQAVGTLVGATAQADYRALRLLRGATARLYRVWADATTEWTTAILRGADAQAIWDRGRAVAITLSFEQLSPFWHGTFHSTPQTLSALSTTAQTLTTTNGGDVTATDGAIVVSVGTGQSLSWIRFVGNGADLIWTGLLAANKILRIDESVVPRAVTNDSVAAYGGYGSTLAAAHASGATAIQVLFATGLAFGGIAIQLDSGAWYPTYIATIVDDTHFTIPAPGLPSAASAGNRVRSGLILSNGHHVNSWLPIVPGANSILVLGSSTAAATVTLQYFDVFG